MRTSLYRTYDTPERFGQENYPLRCTAADAGLVLEGMIKRLMFPFLLAGPVLFILMVLGLAVLPEAYGGPLIAIGGLLSLGVADYILQTHHTHSYYDKQTQRFCIERTWWRRTKTWCWDRAIFRGVALAYIDTRGEAGRSYQLYTVQPGFQVGRFMAAWDRASDEAVLSRLSGYAHWT